MLLLNSKKIVIITPNKCASTTVNDALEKELGAQLILGPQGPYEKFGFTFDDCIGKHSTFYPLWCKNWIKVILVRDRYARFVSLWKHYCRYHDHNVDFEHFIGVVEKFVLPDGWFYTKKIGDYINEVPRDTLLVDIDNLAQLNDILKTNITFPKLHTTEHDDYKSYYTPQLYRRVHDLS